LYTNEFSNRRPEIFLLPHTLEDDNLSFVNKVSALPNNQAWRVRNDKAGRQGPRQIKFREEK